MASAYLAKYLKDYGELAEQLDREIAYYDSFVELFMHYVTEYVPGEAQLGETIVDVSELPPDNHVAYQGMGGDFELVTGLMAESGPFLEFAKRYSGEDLTAIDDLAVDAVEEFLNVVNGFYSVKLAKEEMGEELDLEPPQYARDVEPLGSHLLIIRMAFDFGEMFLLLSTDVVFGEK